MHRTPQPDPGPGRGAVPDARPEHGDVAARRAQVVSRLLSMGVSCRTLEVLFPEWAPVIASAQPLQSGNPR